MEFILFEDGIVGIVMDYDECFIGDFEIKVIFGGVVLVFLDICCGVVVLIYLKVLVCMVMMDLWIDYMCGVELG